MINFDPVQSLHEQAASLQNSYNDNDLFALDLTLWKLVKKLSIETPYAVATNFHLNSCTINLLANASEKSLMKLASGVVCSFVPNQSGEVLLESLKNTCNSYEFDACQGVSGLELYYWQCVKKFCDFSHIEAALAFNLPPKFCLKIQRLTIIDLINNISNLNLSLSVRHSASNIDLILKEYDVDESDYKFHQALAKKIQQSLTLKFELK